ncbi:MAG: CRISPR-associated endoribonuclease Cas6 [Candidatus Thermoplasmatota archaeon]
MNKHAIQGMIYSLLKNTELREYHDSFRFKFFTFSDIFPVGDFQKNVSKNLLVASPNEQFIETLWESLKTRDTIRLKGNDFTIADVKRIHLNMKNRFISGSPIVLYKDNRTNEYYSFERDGNLDFFLERLKENAVKKYNAFYGENFSLNEHIFDRLIFKKEVVVKDYKEGKDFIFIGSVWSVLEKFDINKENRKFYQFVMDCGLGEKNSLGFGFVNPIKK